ncbi:MAG TPA: replication protein RepA [Magnetospirillum sp.]|nr:replication protein RepA [Magnetospirillum sp.]
MSALDEIERHVAAFEASPIQRRLIQAAGEIATDTVDETWYLHTALCQAYLPASRPPPGVRMWERRNGDVTFCLEAGSAYSPDGRTFTPLPLPYGAKARLALIGLTSEAVRNTSPEIDMGRSMTAFLAELLQRSPAGRDIRQFRQQLAALIVATMRIGWQRKDGTPVQISTPIATLVEGLDPAAWAGKETRKGRWPWPRLRLSDPFFGALMEHSVPLDPRALPHAPRAFAPGAGCLLLACAASAPHQSS